MQKDAIQVDLEMVKHYYKKNETIGLLVPIETQKNVLNAAE